MHSFRAFVEEVLPTQPPQPTPLTPEQKKLKRATMKQKLIRKMKKHGFGDSEYVTCTNCADTVHDMLGPKTKKFGYFSGDNPKAHIGSKTGYDGHDFAVYKNFVVDPWVWSTENFHKDGVFDLHDPEDRKHVAHLYGSPKYWKRRT